jgi:hypothetical protein
MIAKPVCAWLALCLIATGCPKRSKDKEAADQEQAETKAENIAPPTRVIVAVTVDWEGAFLSEDGLTRLDEFRTEFPGVPITHFICPAYFTKAETSAEDKDDVRKRVLPGDEVGLHIHAWHSLVEHAGVPLRNTPNIYGDEEPMMEFDDGDRGYEVALSAYTGQEIEAIVTSGKKLLEDAGMGPVSSFRAGGYAGSPTMMAALQRAGLGIDSSASFYGWLNGSRGSFQNLVHAAWPNVSELTQPYEISTSAGPVLEVPNGGGFVEYVSSEQIEDHMARAMERSRELGGEPVYVNFGFHQETADEFTDTLADALSVFRAENPKVLEFATVANIAQAVRKKNAR